jgi:hypothetical protein
VLSRSLGAGIDPVELAIYAQAAFPTAVGALIDVAGTGAAAPRLRSAVASFWEIRWDDFGHPGLLDLAAPCPLSRSLVSLAALIVERD